MCVCINKSMNYISLHNQEYLLQEPHLVTCSSVSSNIPFQLGNQSMHEVITMRNKVKIIMKGLPQYVLNKFQKA